MAYVPENKRTTAWYLFHELFHVRVNPNHVRTADEIKLFGTPTTGNEDYDRELAKNDTLVMLSIAQMEDIFNNGYPVKVANYKDTERIYKLISDHLHFMKNIFVGSENITADPTIMNDLIRLDKFAQAMFEHARYLLTGEVPTSQLAARLMGGRFSSLGMSIRQRAAQRAQAPASKPIDPNRVHTTFGSGGGRDYSSGAEHVPTPPPKPENISLVPDERHEDPRLPKRFSLESMFEDQKRNATRWGG